MELFLSILLFFIVGSVCVVVISNNKNPVATTAWLIVIIFVPLIGLILYLLIGRNYRKNRLYQKLFDANIFPDMSNPMQDAKSYDSTRKSAAFEQFVYRSCFQPVTYQNQTELYFSGEPWLKQMLRDIRQAKHHIHLEFFIWKPDATGLLLRDALLEKAREGVQIRILLDRLGCWRIAYLDRGFLKPLLVHPNVSFSWFYPTRIPFIQIRINYRNHRKIVVIDGEIAYTGGMNIGDEYVAGGRFSAWRDAQLRIHGGAAHSLQMVFLIDWYTATKEYLFEPTYFPLPEVQGRRGVQIVPSGPDQKWESIAQAYFAMINEAQEELLITTPYLIPDDAILMALKTAALRGVEVKLLFPARPDHLFVYWASSSYFYELLQAGVKIYLYQRGFLHAKIMVCDNLVASVGSANLDFRSLYTNFEINALLYSPEDILVLRTQFSQDLRHAREVTLDELIRMPWWVRFRNSFARLFSPLI
jgi:cardiolipin synthase